MFYFNHLYRYLNIYRGFSKFINFHYNKLPPTLEAERDSLLRGRWRFDPPFNGDGPYWYLKNPRKKLNAFFKDGLDIISLTIYKAVPVAQFEKPKNTQNAIFKINIRILGGAKNYDNDFIIIVEYAPFCKEDRSTKFTSQSVIYFNDEISNVLLNNYSVRFENVWLDNILF